MQMKKKNVRKARKKSYQTGGTQQGTTSRAIEVHAVQPPRKFSNFNQSLSKVLECLMQKGLLQPLPNPNPPNPNTSDYNLNKHCKFHQNLKHSTDSCMHLKHEIQNLIDSWKITDPENPNQNTKNNHFLNYLNVPPPAAIVTSSGISKGESPDASKNE